MERRYLAAAMRRNCGKTKRKGRAGEFILFSPLWALVHRVLDSGLLGFLPSRYDEWESARAVLSVLLGFPEVR